MASNEFVGRLIAATDGTLDEIAAGLREFDPAEVAVAVLGEVLARAPQFDGPAEPFVVQFELGANSYLVTLNEGKIEPGRLDEPWLVIRQDLAELVQAVFGPSCDHVTRDVFFKEEPGPTTWQQDDPWLGPRAEATKAAHQVLKACSVYHADLDTLAVRFDTDKWGGHWYTPHYQRHFAAYQAKRVTVLEIGIGGYDLPDVGGGSLLMWKHFFRRGLVYGLDIYDKTGLDQPRLQTIKGDQNDPVFLEQLGQSIGPIDIVVDDGSHLTEHVVTSFNALFPHVRPGGLYVIEDLQTSYWPGYGAGESMGLLKTLLDGLHHQEQVHPVTPGHTDLNIDSITFHHNIAFIHKGRNSEPGAPSWISRTGEAVQSWTP
ncbi:hypothetical protein Lesp02_60140 [Lentzea sp. NBRC 105346]|uniref:class I SAM-dependent methyltransferase n=1 Tax=Lentzea sp. NBRC 105346 TaxID=3032205 RepID=UPI0025547FB3|nr:class I SAM-dependent methyltransferase [Lentzea sp. NBRC 105346]GLZ33826.1 hypothetical protein Lesp02_60140 [Lentzea sp. NBRC 105346]